MFPECLLSAGYWKSYREQNKLGSCLPGAHSTARETNLEHEGRTFLAGEDLEANRQSRVGAEQK